MKKKSYFALAIIFVLITTSVCSAYAAQWTDDERRQDMTDDRRQQPENNKVKFSEVTLESSTPANNGTLSTLDGIITLQFSDDITSGKNSQIILEKSSKKKLPVSVETGDSNLIITPDSELADNTKYKLYVSGLKDSKGLLIKPVTLSFSTAAGTDSTSEDEDISTDSFFKDVDDNYWAYDAITDLAGRGVITGYNDKTFKPNASVTRSQFATMLTKALDLTSSGNTQTFEDVLPSSWDFKAVEAAKSYLTGYKTSSGKLYFYGSKNAVREDMAVALVKALDLTVISGDTELQSAFTDYDEISADIRDYVYTAYKEGIMTGSNNKFNPQGNLTRAEAAVLLERAIEKTEKVVVDEDESGEKVVLEDSGSTLSGLTYNGTAITNFTKYKSSYRVSLPAGTTAIPTVEAVVSDTDATLSITQATALPGTAKVAVTSADGETTRTYYVIFTVLQENDSNATLSSLSYNGLAVTSFSATQSTYKVSLEAGTTSIPTVTAAANDSEATLSITQATALPGTAKVLVTAADGKTTRTYYIVFSVLTAANTDATLSDLSYNGVTVTNFDPATLAYSIELPEGTTEVPTVAATVNDTGDANAEIIAADSLPGVIFVIVTAEDGKTSNTYTISFTVAD